MFGYVNHYSMDSFYCVWVCMSLLGGLILLCLGMYFITQWIHFIVWVCISLLNGLILECWVCISLLNGFILLCLGMYFITRGFILVCLGMYFIKRGIHFSVFVYVFHYSGDSF